MLSSLKGKNILDGTDKGTYLSGLQNALKGGTVSVSEFNRTLSNNELKKFSLLVKQGRLQISDFDSYVNKSSKGLKGLSSAFGSTAKSIALNMGVMLAITAAIKVTAWAFDKANVTFEEQKDKVDGLTEGYNKLKTELDDLKSKNPSKLTSSEKERIDYLEYRLKLEKEILDIENRKLADSAIYGKGDITSGGISSKTAGFDNSLITNKNDTDRYLKELESIDKVRKNLSTDLNNSNNIKQLENLTLREQKINDILSDRKSKYLEIESGYLKNAEDIRSFIDIGAYKNDPKALAEVTNSMNHNLEQAKSIRNIISDIEGTMGNEDFFSSAVFKTLEDDLKELAKQGKLTSDALADNKYSELNELMKSLGVSVEDLIKKLNGVSDSDQAFSPLISAVNDYEDAVSALPEKLAEVEEIQDKVNDGYSFSYDEIEKLKAKYPELESAIYRTADGWGIEKEAVDLLHGSVGDLGEQYANVQSVMTEALNSDVAVRLSNLGIELEGIKTIADAYAAIAGARQKAGGATPLSNGAAGATLPSKNADLSKLINISAYGQDAINFGKEAERLSALQEKLKDLQSGRVSGGSPSKSKSSKETEAYKAQIDAYAKLQAELDKIQADISANEKKFNDTKDDKEKIALLQQRIALTQQEQVALHNLNNARDKEIANNVKLLQQKGFDVSYNPDLNNLEISNLEHLNDLKGKNQEKTNDLIKEYEELIKSTQSLNEENKKSSTSWWDSYYNLSKYKDEIKDLNEEIYNKEVDNQEHLLELLSSVSGTEAQQIAIREDMQRKALQRRQTLIDEDYATNIEEIRDLENAWKTYYDKVLELQKQQLESEKKLLEQQKSDRDSALSAITSVIDDKINQIQKEKDALSEANDERERKLKLQELEANAEKARSQKTAYIYRENRGFEYEVDQTAVNDAQNAINDYKSEQKLKDKQKALQDEIDSLQEYKNKWEEVANAVEEQENKQKVAMLLGSNWKSKIIGQDTSVLTDFKDDYIDVEKSINEKTKDIETITTELANHLDTEFNRIIKSFEDMTKAIGGAFGIEVTDAANKESTPTPASESKQKSSNSFWDKIVSKVTGVFDLLTGSTSNNTSTLEENNTNLKTSSSTQKTNTEEVKDNSTNVKSNSTYVDTNSTKLSDNSSSVDTNSDNIETLNDTLITSTDKIVSAAETVATAKESRSDDDDDSSSSSSSGSSGSGIGKVIGKVIGGIGKVIGSLTKHHSGGIIGDTSDKSKALFELSNQKLKSDEEVIIGQSGELVLTKEQQSNIVDRLNQMSSYNQSLFSSLSSNLGNYTGYLPNNFNVPTGIVSDYSVNGNSNKDTVVNQTVNVQNHFDSIEDVEMLKEAMLTFPQTVKQMLTSGYNR